MKTRRTMIMGAFVMLLVSFFLAGSASAQNTCPGKALNYSDSEYANLLNGLDFRGKMAMYGQEDAKDEELRFRDGVLYSDLSRDNGFDPAEFSVRKGSDDYTIHFCSQSTNSKGDQMLWHGTIKLDHTGLTKRHKIEAYATLIPSEDSSRFFWMKGKASEQSMKYSGKNAPKQMQTASKGD